jgi:hypothetical protein
MSTDPHEFSAFVPVIASVLTHLTQRNKDISITSEKLKVFHSLKVPPIGISEYLQRIVKYAYCSSECFIFALIYLDRLITQNKNCHITLYNVHRLLITSVLLAAKGRDDTYYSNAYYSAIGGISNSEINKLEVAFLLLVDFNLFITPETYEQYKTYLLHHSSSSSTTTSTTPHMLPSSSSDQGLTSSSSRPRSTNSIAYMEVEAEDDVESQDSTVNDRDYCLPGVCPVTT